MTYKIFKLGHNKKFKVDVNDLNVFIHYNLPLFRGKKLILSTTITYFTNEHVKLKIINISNPFALDAIFIDKILFKDIT